MHRADVVAWLLTYLVHSTLLLGAAWLLISRRLIRSHHLQDTFWKAALVGGIFTATAQMAVGIRPLGTVALSTAPVPVFTSPTIHEAPVIATLPADEPIRLSAPSPAPRSALRDVPASSARPSAGDTLLIVWLALASLLILHLLIARALLSRRLGRRQAVIGTPLRALLESLCQAAGVRRPIRLTSADGLSSPVALGRSEICVPQAVLTDLDQAQQRSVLAHELAHLTRFDPLWLVASCMIERVFFFQPLNRVARRRLQETAEYLCDDWAVRRTGSGLVMAKSLIKVAEWMHGGPQLVPLSGMAETPSQLVARVRRLVENREMIAPRRRWQVPAAFALIGLTAAAVPGVTASTHSAAVQSPTAQDTTHRRVRRPRMPVAEAAPMVSPMPVPTPTPPAPPRMPSGALAVDIDAPALRALARDAMTSVRMQMPVLADLRHEPQDTASTSRQVTALMAALKDADVEVRRVAAHSLGQLEDSRAVPGLIGALHDSDADVRQQSAWALAQLEDKRATAPLAEALKDANVEVRRNAAWGLGQLEDKSAEAPLAAALKDSDTDVRRKAAWALGQLQLDRAPQALIDALSDKDADVRRTSAWALSQMGDARAVPALRAMLADSDADARRNAINALGQIRDSSAMQAIIGAMQSKDADVRRAAARALGER